MSKIHEKKTIVAIFVTFILAAFLVNAFADDLAIALWKLFPSGELMLAKVQAASLQSSDGVTFQMIAARVLAGADFGKEIELRNQGVNASDAVRRVAVGETIIVTKNQDFTNDAYVMLDRLRLKPLLFILLFFIFLAVLVGKSRGITSLLGLGISLAVVFGFVIPGILAGHSATVFAFIGALVIAPASLYLTHGFNKQTSIAVLGTMLSLGIAYALCLIFVSGAKLIGIQNEQLFYIQTVSGAPLNLPDLLIAAIIIGTLGVLEDITIAQSVTVFEIKKANPRLGSMELYEAGSSIGREHIGSLINTLVLAYAGTSLPDLLYIAFQNKNLPFWLVLNGEQLADEIVRVAVGGSALIIALPLTTALAAFFFGKDNITRKIR